jgi:DNA-binding NarL/FixJ family response regulator
VNLKNLYPTIVLVSAALFFAYDIVHDLMADNERSLHIFIEAIVFMAVSTVLFQELRRLGYLRAELSEERSRTARLSGELLAVMRSQFSQWGLTPSEGEVALLLIKGLSMREIAEAREVKEKTVRQQATSVYAKSGYAGRHELVAHFIEDLMNAAPLGD